MRLDSTESQPYDAHNRVRRVSCKCFCGKGLLPHGCGGEQARRSACPDSQRAISAGDSVKGLAERPAQRRSPPLALGVGSRNF